MRWFRSLFWKIFFAIWLSSLVMLAATVFIVSQVNERERVQDWLLESVRLNTEQLVDDYERSDGLSKRRRYYYHQRFSRSFYQRWREHNGDDDGEHRGRGQDDWRRDHGKRGEPPRIRIYPGDSERPIFGGRDRHKSGPDPLELTVQSESGARYRVEISSRAPELPMRHLFRFMLSYQIVVILLATALASVLLTLLIVRPLNRLRDHTRELYQGNLASRAGGKLSRRRDEIGELAREFNSMADYVEQTLVGGQKLLQDVSHELRAPLARLQVAAGLAEQKLGEGDRLSSRINLECEQLNRLIDEILSLSRLDAQPLDTEPYALSGLLDELADDVRFSAPQRVLHWPGAGLQVVLPGNRCLLQRALSNVLTNALRHTPDAAEIYLNVTQAGSELVLTIRDTGPGVDEALLPVLLEPFVRAEGKKTEGYGLGLSIARRAVERLQGSLRLRNHPEGGLEVSVRLPL